MKPIQIIAGIDFAPESELAAGQALEIARHLGGELVLLHAGDTVELPEPKAMIPDIEREAVARYRDRLAAALRAHREELSALRERLSGQGPVVSQVLHEGFPDTAICQAAAEMGADLVVVGTHGRTGLRWFFLGSVADRVVRLCPVDVLVARGERAGAGGYRHILVATDFSASAERALDRALALAAERADVDVVHHYGAGWPSFVFGGVPTLPMPPDLDGHLKAAAEQKGAELVGSRRRPGVALSFEALPGLPVPGIVHRLESSRYDLAALGSHGRRGVRRFVLGSTAEAVVRRAPCSVLIARGPGAA